MASKIKSTSKTGQSVIFFLRSFTVCQSKIALKKTIKKKGTRTNTLARQGFKDRKSH